MLSHAPKHNPLTVAQERLHDCTAQECDCLCLQVDDLANADLTDHRCEKRKLQLSSYSHY
jgi:nitrate/nitrite-specific signal transduction histidine kinase